MPRLVEPKMALRPRKRRRVQCWVPWYGRAASQTALNATYGGNGPGNCLTDLALQYWCPTGGGTTVSLNGSLTTGADVTPLKTWAQSRGIRCLLCCFNSPVSSWDWDLAKSAFDPTNRTAFIAALIAEMNAQGLDGIDIDFEATDTDYPARTLNDDQASYVAFIIALRAAMPGRKTLTLSSFPYIWNAPNSAWWPQLLPYLTALNSMGYGDTGKNGTGFATAAYSAQRIAAKPYGSKFMMGMYSSLATWQGDPAQAQIDWFLTQADMGIGIWDAQITNAAWQTSGVWASLKRIREAGITV